MALKIIGHRGSGRNEENPFAADIPAQHTRLSFERVIQNGADGVEFDIFISQDLVPFVIHRQGAIDLKISELTKDQIARLPLPDGQHIHTLEEVLVCLAEIGVRYQKPLLINAELKGPGVVQKTRDVIEDVASRYPLDPRQIYFDALEWDRLKDMRALDPHAQIMPALSTSRLFNIAGKGNSLDKHYDKNVLAELEAFIADQRCCGIDVMTADIQPEMIALAQRMDVGFCSYPQGPHPERAADIIQRNIGLLDDFSRQTRQPVIIKVEDVVAARGILSDHKRGSSASLDKVERMMGMRLSS